MENYGELNFYISIGSVTSIFLLFGLNTTVITYLAKGAEGIKYQANSMALISNILGFILLLVITNYSTSLLLIGLSFLSMTVAEILGRRLYKTYFLIILCERITQIGLAMILYFVIGLEGIILGYALGALFFSYKFFISLKRISLNINEVRQRFKFLMHSYALNISQTLTLHADKLLIGPVFGFTMLGLYQLGFQFLMLLSIVPSSLFQYLLPQYSGGNRNSNTIYIGLVVAALLVLISIVLMPIAISNLFPRYVEVVPTAQIMSIGIIPMTVNAILNSRLLAKEESRRVLISALVYSISLLGLFYFLGTTMGLKGLGISLVVSLSFQSLILIVFSKGSFRSL
ncbi:MAG TPA: hypothetical protein VNI77_00395 [Nitrososphaera sp.]|nr:hypothetical protein [Nitrososphaera sp.]